MKEFITPELKVINFTVMDVITTSEIQPPIDDPENPIELPKV